MRGRPDEDQPRVGAGAHEGDVLGQEAVPGMDRLRPGQPGRVEQVPHRQVGLPRRGRADPHRLVGLADVPGAGVGVAVDGDGADAERPQGADDPDRDLPPVGDQYDVKRRARIGHIRKMP